MKVAHNRRDELLGGRVARARTRAEESFGFKTLSTAVHHFRVAPLRAYFLYKKEGVTLRKLFSYVHVTPRDSRSPAPRSSRGASITELYRAARYPRVSRYLFYRINDLLIQPRALSFLPLASKEALHFAVEIPCSRAVLPTGSSTV